MIILRAARERAAFGQAALAMRFYSTYRVQFPKGINPMVFEQRFRSRDGDEVKIPIATSRLFFYCIYVWEANR